MRLDHVARAPGPVRHRRRDREPAPAADPHPLDTVVPALDHLAAAELERERLAPVPRGVELVARREGDADVVHRYLAARNGLRALADDEVLDPELERDVALGLRDLRSIGHGGSFGRAAGTVPGRRRPDRDDVIAGPMSRAARRRSRWWKIGDRRSRPAQGGQVMDM